MVDKNTWMLLNTVGLVVIGALGVMFWGWVISEIQHLKNKKGGLR